MTISQARKKPAQEDWHKADIIAAVHKAGWSMQQLAFANGYKARTALTNALRNRYPRAERLIADAIGKLPGQIWPSRYESDLVTPNSQGGAKPKRPAHAGEQATTRPTAGHQQ